VPTRLKTPLDLEATLHSGQAFRWRRLDDGGHEGFINNQPVCLWLSKGRLEVDSSVPEAQVLAYLGSEPGAPKAPDAHGDAGLQAAVERFPGLRLLRQDPWEALIAFIISQNSNEAKIRATIEALCRLAAPDAIDRPPHPTPQELAAVDERRLRQTGMGYRAPYVLAAAKAVAEGALDPRRLPLIGHDAARSLLMDMPGIGPKVADCILLYGCGYEEAFPIDVWVRRLLAETYMPTALAEPYDTLRRFAWRRFGSTAGWAQHYLFHYRRRIGPLPATPIL
jgi:N-glycosylase/DNA lyase